MQKIVCPSCGDKYAQVALHWSGKECDRPDFSDYQLELMRGLLLGDADIKPVTNGSIFRLRMTNKQFLEWVSSELSPLSRGVFLSESSDKQKESALRGGLQGTSSDSTFSDLYGLRTITHPQVDGLYEWYSSGEKRYPNHITGEMFRMWYVTDGWKDKEQIRIRCKAQTDDKEHVVSLVESLDFVDSVKYNTRHGTVNIRNRDSKQFWQETEAPPGFEYKWPDNEVEA